MAWEKVKAKANHGCGGIEGQSLEEFEQGIIGALATGILVNPALGGAGIVNYLDPILAAIYDGTATQVWWQFKGVLVTLLWSGLGSAILYKIVDLIVGLRASPEAEREGLDRTSHGEAAYHSS